MDRRKNRATHCRASMGAGMLIKQKWKCTEAFLRHSLQSLYGSWNVDKTKVNMYGATHCRASMGAGILIKQR